jgi:myo-inositol-1(or 4)-monophosphatase
MTVRPSGDELAIRFDAALAVAREAGDLASGYFRDRATLEVKIKGAQDRTTEADREVEVLIRERLLARFPGDGFLGEEGGGGISGEAPGLWVVDPIDGTECLIEGIPTWSVSIAFVVAREIEIGVVYDPNAGEMFAARRSHGTTVNGDPVHASAATSFAEGLVGLGHSTRVEARATLEAMDRLLADGGMFIRTGSGALMIAYVAAGRLLAYYEAHINSWDCLAGICLVREAGGWTNNFLAGDGLNSGNPIAAAAPGLEDAIKKVGGLA